MTGTAEAEAFTRRLTAFSTGTPDVLHVVAVAPEGLLIGRWGGGDRSDADRLAAITSGLTSLAGGAARSYRLGVPRKVVIEFATGHLWCPRWGTARCSAWSPARPLTWARSRTRWRCSPGGPAAA